MRNLKAFAELEGKAALVTGASRGIARAIALAQAGADVAVNFRARELEANTLVGTIGAWRRRVVTVRADVSREEDVDRLVRETEESWGPIYILVNNVAIANPVSLDTVGPAEWGFTMGQNLRLAFLVSHAVLSGMRSR